MEQKQRVGIILAIELDAILELYPDCRELSAPVGFKLYTVEKEHCDIFILRSGMGEIAAAAGVQYLISRCGVSAIINFGVVGGLSHEMKLHKICLVEQVVHYKFDCSEFMELAVGQVDGHDSIYLRTDKALFDKARALAPELPKSHAAPAISSLPQRAKSCTSMRPSGAISATWNPPVSCWPVR